MHHESKLVLTCFLGDPIQDLRLALNRYDGIDTRIKRYLTAGLDGGLSLDENSLAVKSRNYILPIEPQY